MAVVSLVESPDLNNRKVQVNSGFQVNFDLPISPFNFSNPINFPGISKREIHQDYRSTSLDYEKYGGGNATKIVNDLSAGAFYASLKDLLSL